MSVVRAVFAVVSLFVASIPAVSQELGTKTYRYATGLEEICKKSSGGYYAGKIIEEFPSGTIFEVSTFSNGYYTGVSPKTGKKGFLYNSSDAKSEFINPYNIIGSIFHTWIYEYDEYGYKDPAAAPKSHNVLTINHMPNGEKDDALIQVTYITDAETQNEKKIVKEYIGKFLPYCVTVTHLKNNGEPLPIEEYRIYLSYIPDYKGMKIVGAEIVSALINGDMWDIAKRVYVNCDPK